MDLPNRRQRRYLAKQAGLLKQKSESSFKEQLEITRRAREMGRTIHLHNTEEILRKMEENEIKTETNIEKSEINREFFRLRFQRAENEKLIANIENQIVQNSSFLSSL